MEVRLSRLGQVDALVALCLAILCGASATFVSERIVGWVCAVAAIGAGAVILRRTFPMPEEEQTRTDQQTHASRLAYVAMLIAFGSVSILAFRLPSGVALSDAAFYFALLVTIIGVSFGTRERFQVLPWPVVVGAGLFAIGGFVSALEGASPTLGVVATIQFVYLMTVWLWAGVHVLDTINRASYACGFWVAAGALSGAYALMQFFGLAPLGESWQGRFVGLTEHVNDAGALSAIVLVTRE